MTIVPRREVDSGEWDAFVASRPEGWIWHLSPWLDYLAAAPGRVDESYALIKHTGDIYALCPAVLPVPPDDPLPMPLRLDPSALPWPTRGQPQRARPDTGFATRVLDLSLPVDALWANLRRSSHALIHRAEEGYAVRPAETLDGLASLYRQRPDLPQITEEQWACLRRLHKADRLQVWEAQDGMGDVVGAAAIYVWKGWSYYGHGRTLGGKGVAHLLQWRVIRALKAIGVPHYEVGWSARPEDDEKARQIAHFKQGLGGAEWWVPTKGLGV